MHHANIKLQNIPSGLDEAKKLQNLDKIPFFWYVLEPKMDAFGAKMDAFGARGFIISLLITKKSQQVVHNWAHFYWEKCK